MIKLWKPVLLLAAIAVMVIGMLGSGAWFTDSASSTPGSLTSGTLSIDDAKLSTTPLGTISNMAPGDVTGDVEIVIQNNGSLNLAWVGNLVVTGNGTLKQAIYIDYAKMEFLSPTGNNWQAEGTDIFITDGVGSGPYPGYYNTLAGMSPFRVITLNNFDGSNPMGVPPNEFAGALKPGYSYKLTLRFGFAEGAGNAYQGLGPLDISFSALATQITAGAIDAMDPSDAWCIVGPSCLLPWFEAQIADQTES